MNHFGVKGKGMKVVMVSVTLLRKVIIGTHLIFPILVLGTEYFAENQPFFLSF